jgi:hypothetical protein
MTVTMVPRRFGKYPVLGVLGRGAMGSVYRAFDPDIRRAVAIKTIRWDLLHEGGPGASLAARFRNEARAAGRLSHPGIVAVYEYGHADDCAYIAMEYVEGCTLREYFAHGAAFPEADAVSIMAQLLDALGHAHGRQVWHRDIKPANLIVMNDGRLKVADFGIARIEASEAAQAFPVMGTPGYIPPEMYRGEAGDQRADLFAAGAVLYQLLTGRAPFEGAAASVMFKVCHQDPPPMQAAEATRRWARYDPALAAALAKAPERRFASAASFRDALLAAYGQPVNSRVSRETALLAPCRGADHGTVDTAARTARPTEPGQARTPWPQGWDPTTLGSVETRLANVVGPMAHALVQRAAQRCGDLGTLVSLIAAGLDTAQQRQAFLSAAAGAAPTPTPDGDPPAYAPLEADEIEWASRALARHIGPLARVIVKRASAQTTGTEQFYRRIVEAISGEADREAFLRDVRSRGRAVCR